MAFVAGMTLSSVGFYEFCTTNKLNSDNYIYKHSSTARLFSDSLNHLNVVEKLALGGPLILFGVSLCNINKNPK